MILLRSHRVGVVKALDEKVDILRVTVDVVS